MIFASDVLWRMSIAGRYSGESYHCRARSSLSNSPITTRWGFLSPSGLSILPPRAPHLPQYLSPELLRRSRYASSPTGAAPPICAISEARRDLRIS